MKEGEHERMKGGTKERGMDGEWVGPGKGVCESGWKRGATTRGEHRKSGKRRWRG